MDINQSTVAGNLSAVPDLMKQGGVSNQKEEKKSRGIWETNIVDIQKFVVIFFRDLGTFEQVQSLLLCWSLEETPWCHYQYVVFTMTLFHLKMVCTDALWCIFVSPKDAWQDEN